MNRTEESNYFNDPRVRAARERGQIFTVFLDDDETEVALPTHFVVCPTCRGTGTHVNPSIDCGGRESPADEWFGFPDDDPYLNGEYDVPCYGCDGNNVVARVDESRCTPEQLAAYRLDQDAEAELEAACRAEICAGC